MEFIFSQTAPAVCLLCKQTDFTKRIIALFRVLLYRVIQKKLLKIQNTRLNQLELEFSFSFDRAIKERYAAFLHSMRGHDETIIIVLSIIISPIL